MITRARAFAKKIIDQGYNIVPLFPYSKNNQDANWQNRRYSLDSVLDDSNVGINLLQSNLLDVDLDSALATLVLSRVFILLLTYSHRLARLPSI